LDFTLKPGHLFLQVSFAGLPAWLLLAVLTHRHAAHVQLLLLTTRAGD